MSIGSLCHLVGSVSLHVSFSLYFYIYIYVYCIRVRDFFTVILVTASCCSQLAFFYTCCLIDTGAAHMVHVKCQASQCCVNCCSSCFQSVFVCVCTLCSHYSNALKLSGESCCRDNGCVHGEVLKGCFIFYALTLCVIHIDL